MEGVIADLKKRHTTVVFSTHIMEHADRLCDRILLIAGGAKVLDGTIAEAKHSIPRRIRIETQGDPSALRAAPGVKRIVDLPAHPDSTTKKYEILLEERADPNEIIGFCFQNHITLTAFDRSDPSLREVFIAKVNEQGASGFTQ